MTRIGRGRCNFSLIRPRAARRKVTSSGDGTRDPHFCRTYVMQDKLRSSTVPCTGPQAKFYTSLRRSHHLLWSLQPRTVVSAVIPFLRKPQSDLLEIVEWENPHPAFTAAATTKHLLQKSSHYHSLPHRSSQSTLTSRVRMRRKCNVLFMRVS